MITQAKYTLLKGVPWERLIVVKDRLTHRTMKTLDAWATVQTGTTKRNIPVSIIPDGSIMLQLSADETLDLPDGELNFDVVAVVQRRSALAGGGWTSVTTPVASGTITVSTPSLVSTLKEAQVLEIRFKKGEDYRNSFTWTSSDGSVLQVVDAYMQAKNTETDTVVIDLRWFATKPSESTILGLPGAQRGYLAPFEGESLELHISDMNTVPAGSYPFDLFVKGESGDWTPLSEGFVVVEPSVSSKPV